MFKEFDSVDDAFAWMKRQEDLANREVHPIQQKIVRGTHAMRLFHDFPIFGYIFTEDELREGERSHGADEDELAFTMEVLAKSYERGYRHGRWYSVVEPEGELGDTHILNLTPITRNDFEEAQSYGWQVAEDELFHIMSRGIRMVLDGE
jgi:hypothetical protein